MSLKASLKESICHRMLSARINTTSAVLAFVILAPFPQLHHYVRTPHGLTPGWYLMPICLLAARPSTFQQCRAWTLVGFKCIFFPLFSLLKRRSVILCVFGIQVPFFYYLFCFFFFTVTPHNLVYFYFYIKFNSYFSLSLSN